MKEVDLASLACLFPVVLILGVLGVMALFKPVNAKLGLRNIFRRKGNTALVVVGLMVSTSIIGASFIVGDTMDEMVTSLIVESYYEVDLSVGYLDNTGGYGPISPSLAANLSANFTALSGVDAVAGIFVTHLSVFDVTSKLAEPSVQIVGYDSSFDSHFGDLLSGGTPVADLPGPWDIIMNEAAARNLDASVGDSITVYGVNHTNRQMNVTHIVADSEKGHQGGASLFMNLNTVNLLTAMDNGTVNGIAITLDGGPLDSIDSIPGVAKEVVHILESAPYNASGMPNLVILQNKKDVIDNISDSIGMLTDMFIVLGSFSIIAGIVLIINIFTMLAEERKSELGIARAIGTSRSFLRRMFLFEGTAYTVMSVLIGVLMAIPLAFGIIWAFSSIFQDEGGTLDILPYFTFETSSIVISVVLGFLIAVATIYVTTFKISRLNIVRAVRNIPEPPPERKDRSLLWLGVALTVVGTLSTLLAFPSDRAMFFWPGLSLVFIGLAVIARRFVSDRAAFTVAGILILIGWSLPIDLEMEAGMEMWVLSGVFMVSSAVAILIYNFDALVAVLDVGLRWVHRSIRPILKMAIAYPSTSKFKTALTVFIFTIVIFTITVMSMISGFNTANADQFKEEVSGGMDIFGTAGLLTPVDNISARIAASQNLSDIDFDYIEGFVQAGVQLRSEAIDQNMPDQPFFYLATGVTQSFVDNTSFSLMEYEERFSSEDAVWDEVLSNSSCVIVDSWIGYSNPYGPSGTYVAGVGDTLSIVMMDGTLSEKRVVAILDSILLNGVFVKREFITQEMNVTGERMFLIRLGPGEDIHEVSLMLERELLPFQFQTIELDALIDTYFEATDSIFTLFDAFLGLGLIVGIAGLGIITIRSVHERRQQIGMLRAIGFKRSWVMASFALEAAIITILGIVIGVLLGIDVGWNLWYSEMRPMDYAFYIPWGEILLYAGIAFIVTLLATIIPSRKAATVAPADALRYE